MTLRKFIEPNSYQTTLVQLLLPIAVMWAISFDAGIGWWLTAFLFYGFYCAIGNNLAMHRYFTHNQFTVSKPIECLFVWFSSMGMFGSPSSYAIPHLIHHRYPDTDLDPHGPSAGLKSIIYYYHRNQNLQSATLFSRRILELTKRYGWLHKYYGIWIVANLTILALLGTKVFVFCWLLPASLSLWAVSISIYLQHWPNKPSNNSYYTLFGWGEGLHKNHHDMPGKSNTAVNSGETDYMHLLAQLFARNFNQK